MLIKEFLNTPKGRRIKADADSRCPNPNARKYQPRGGEPGTFVSPNFGDGGWHTTPGCQRFVTEWEPLRDHIMVGLFSANRPGRSTRIFLPESVAPDTTTRVGVVLKCGPGKRVPGRYRLVGAEWKPDENGIQWPHGGRKKWVPEHRKPMQIKVGMTVIIGQFHDWRALDAGFGDDIVICQEADVRVFY